MSGDYICLFKAIVFDENDKENTEDCGFCFANSFAEATAYLEKELYGDNLMTITHMELLDVSPIVSHEVWEAMRGELNEG